MAIFNGLADFVARILAFFYELPVVGDNYGLAIILLTFTVMVLLMPLTLKATRSTIKMQQIQPELRRVQKEFKSDREQMNAELMKLYSENGINPVGGCLPMLAQMPVFLVLFRILRGLTTRLSEQPFFSVANKIRVAGGQEALNGNLFDPQHLSSSSKLYRDLREHEEMKFGPLDLAAHALDVVRSDFIQALPYIILILVMVGLSFYQQHQITARRSSDTELSPMLQQQQQIMRFLPLMTGIWAFIFPAGLVLYWTTSSVFRIGQQAYIGKRIYGQVELPPTASLASGLEKAKPTADSDTGKPKSDTPSGSRSKSESRKNVTNPEAGSDSTADTGDDKTTRQQRLTARQEEWDRRRAKATKKRTESKDAVASSRVTPKGTQPGSTPSRDKRKKKR